MKKSLLQKYVKIATGIFIGLLLLTGIRSFFRTGPENRFQSEVQPVGESLAAHLPELRGWAETGAADLTEGVRLAKMRGERMSELIRRNPEQAIKEALTLSVWGRLPAAMQVHVEQPFSAVADVEVLVACGGTTARTFIETDFPGIGKMQTYVYGRRGEVGSKSGTPVQGIRVGNVGALRENVFQSLERDDELAALALYPVAVSKQGNDAVAALAGGKIFYFKDQTALAEANNRLAEIEERPGPAAGVQALFQSLEAYVTEEGDINFQTLEEEAIAAAAEWTGTPRDMIVIMCDFPDVTGQPVDPAAFSNSINSTVSQQIREMSYEKTHVVGTVNPATYRLPAASHTYIDNSGQLYADATALAQADGINLSQYDTVCVLFPHVPALDFAGLASVGGSSMWLNGATGSDTVIHELGHNYGTRHASFWEVASDNPVDPAGELKEYGDFTDVMGDGDAPEGHYNIWHKKHIGWLENENWQSVVSSGTYRIYRMDESQTTGLLRGLEIAKAGSDKYWVGLRQSYTSYDTFGRGVSLIWKKSGDNRSYLIDTTPQSIAGKYDAGLALGKTYSDYAANVHVTPVARGGQVPDEWMDIRVNLGSFPGNSAPSAAINGPLTADLGASVLFSVAASDSDGDELAYYWDTGDGYVKANSPTVAAVWFSGSSATISCIVTDMKGGTNRVSRTIALDTNLGTWAPQTSGTVEDLNDVAVGGGRIVAVGDEAVTAYSDDGTNWTLHTDFNVSDLNISLYGVHYDGTQFIATGMDYDLEIDVWEQVLFTSPDGTYWTKRYDSNSGMYPVLHILHDAASGGGTCVAVGDTGNIVRSADRVTWAEVPAFTTNDLRSISYGDGRFVAVGTHFSGGPPEVYTSTDGLNWTDRSAGVDLDSWKGLWNIEYCNGRFLAGGWYARIMHSIDQGTTFTTSMNGDRYEVPAFAYGDGIYFAAGINKDDGDADVNFLSTDGASWSVISAASQADRNAACFFGGAFITVGDNGSIRRASAGSQTAGFANWQLTYAAAMGFNRDPSDDADFDGFINLAEYALGTSATDAGSVPVAVATQEVGNYFAVSYTRDSKKDDISYTVERANGLVSNDWNTAGTVTVEDSATTLTVRSAYTMASQTNEFMRLKMELQ